MNPAPKQPLANILAACMFIALAMVSAGLFLRAFPAPPYPQRVSAVISSGIDRIESATSPDAVAARMEPILALGDRCAGRPGYSAAQSLVQNAYRAAGLELLSQPVTFPAPVTQRRKITTAGGDALPGVEVYPLLPNQLQPIVTPDGGLTGRLELVTDELLAEATKFDDLIAVIDPRKPPKNYGLSWTRYAQAGFKAVIVADRQGLAEFKPGILGGMVGGSPINFVRLAANEKIYDHLGSLVTLDVHVEWQNIQSTNYIGVLRAGNAKPGGEAVVIHAEYDAPSYLPDVSPGAIGALNLALHLNLVDALASTRHSLQRDVIFVAHGSRFMANIGLDRLLAAAGPAHLTATARQELSERLAQLKADRDAIHSLRQICSADGFLIDPAQTARALSGQSGPALELLEEQLKFTINQQVMELGERVIATRITDLQSRGTADENAALAAFQAAKREQEQASSASAYGPVKLAQERGALVKNMGIAARLARRLDELDSQLTRGIAQAEADLAVNALFSTYSQRIAMGVVLAPADPTRSRGEAVAFNGGNLNATSHGELLRATDRLLLAVARDLGALSASPSKATGNGRYEPLDARLTQKGDRISPVTPTAQLFNTMGWPGFDLVNCDRSDAYAAFTSPAMSKDARELKTVRWSMRFAGQTALGLASGMGWFEPNRPMPRYDFAGRVLAGGIGKSIIPNHPLAHALVASKTGLASTGLFASPVLRADAEGVFSLPFNSSLVVSKWTPLVEAVGFDERGLINWIRDEGAAGKAFSGPSDATRGAEANLRLMTFRASPVCVLDLVNPQTLRSYTSVSFVHKDLLSEFPRINQWSEGGALAAAFLEPDQRFYVLLRAGAEGNPLVQQTRAFTLGVERGFVGDPKLEIDGPGYLVAQTPFVRDVPGAVARSMMFVNQKRVDLQLRHGMLDRQSLRFQDRTRDLLAQADAPNLSQRATTLLEQDAVTFAQLNHPVLRESISEAVVGILWYLGLLVPFVFFFEKLALGYTDIRKQLLAHAVIFVLVFALLRVLHPAFEMVRSSVMILLGFVIMLISLGVTALFSGKFGENLDELRRMRGQVASAEADRGGVIATAFLLGLNNMHRRKVRTGLTCATLVLMTFAMICFAGVQSRTTSVATALGKASYQGLLIRPEKFTPIDDGELFALTSRYGREFQVAPRYMLVGIRTYAQTVHNPDLALATLSESGPARRAPVDSILTLSYDEPLRGQIRLLTRSGWFTQETVEKPGTDAPVMLPDTLATELGITASQVDAAGATGVAVQLNGKQVSVMGIFDSQAFSQLRDLDGRDLLPFNIEAARAIEVVNNSAIVPDDTPRLSAARLVISGRLFRPVMSYPIVPRLTSVAIAMPGLPYRQVKEHVEKYLSQTGQPASYGIDGVAYFGWRTRASSFNAFLEMIAPLLIAGITVLNTMRGSVYERREEIFVYNAVGIAPRYIFFMFIAEAVVYAVVASVLGYLLSQGIGKVLTVLNLTGGLNMSFTSITTIWASVAVMICVFVSTYFPARSAMKIAQTSDDSGWKLPPTQGDTMEFDLPFTFDWHDRVAVLSFFHRFFLDHGPGSSGRFLTGFDRWTVDPAAGEKDSLIPRLSTTVWLKPFDLGVSQRIDITLPLDPLTGEYIARLRLTRLTGTNESWLRLNAGFVATLRRQFLHWRAVTPDQRAAFFSEARAMLENAVPERSA